MNAISNLEGTAVLVTGGTGFIGSHLVEALINRGCRVHCIVRKSSNLKWLPTQNITLHETDITNPELPDDCLNEIQHVFHCAGLTSAKTRQDYFEVNADACRALFELLIPHADHLNSIIHLSSLAAIGPSPNPPDPVNDETPCHPVTHYGKSKLAGEKIALEYCERLPMVVIRPPVVYGEREQNFFSYLQKLKQGWRIQVGNEPRHLSIVNVHDLVKAILLAAESPEKENPVYLVTDGEVYSWEEVSRIASNILNVNPRKLTLPLSLIRFAGMVSEMKGALLNQPAFLDRQRVKDIRQLAWTASADKFFNAYDFRPEYSLERGLKITLDWYKEKGWL
ncbi:MAG: NAD(P)-dependent oxidoreductase [Candidatus Nitronauta litoralis]|uniref:NAD(P)-dependent oxidoreductase n=1 Tax=Candidatus Nitronauta litoralis TaxID=2705533 RepID=A0A7T0G1A5_9BACT|nr:MAG: NAD(P)-dependent oxidoreductase [Candidatus Nitronauta litoralis]